MFIVTLACQNILAFLNLYIYSFIERYEIVRYCLLPRVALLSFLA